MTKERIGLILLGLVGLALLGSGLMKFTQPAEMVEAIGSMPLYFLGLVELLIVASLAMKPTRLLGIILAASYTGGIIAFSWLAADEVPLAGLILSTMLYVGAALYRPWLTNNTEAGTHS